MSRRVSLVNTTTYWYTADVVECQRSCIKCSHGVNSTKSYIKQIYLFYLA